MAPDKTPKSFSRQEINIRNQTITSVRRPPYQKAADNYKKSFKTTLNRHIFGRGKRFVRFSILATNVALLAAVGTFVFHNTKASSGSASGGNLASLAVSNSKNESDPLDKLSSADVAVHVARLAQLDESTAVTNKADTVKTELIVTQSDDKVITKPQIVSTALKSNQDIVRYTAVAGDTISSVAAKFGVTSDTIRNSNNLTEEKIPAGRILLISPVNGIVYIVKSGDSVDSLAARFRASRDQIIAFNDAEIGGLKVGEAIVIPDGLLPTSNGGSYASYQSAYTQGFSFGATPIYGGNGYDYGWCTWHAANRRQEIGQPIPTNFGNAISWLSAARATGLSVGSVPRDGAVLYHTNIGGLGHVAFVERVNGNGSVLVSDMNYPIWGKVTYRTLSAGEASSYRYIY